MFKGLTEFFFELLNYLPIFFLSYTKNSYLLNKKINSICSCLVVSLIFFKEFYFYLFYYLSSYLKLHKNIYQVNINV